jgi:hypothetical protein
VSDPDEAALEAVLDELDAAQAWVCRAAFAVAELEEGREEGEASRAELAATLAELEVRRQHTSQPVMRQRTVSRWV